MSLPDVGNCWNNFPGYAQTADDVVQSDLVDNWTKERRQRLGTEKNPWYGQLPNGLVVAA